VRRCVDVEAVQNAAGRSAEICTKSPQIYNAELCRNAKTPKGADVALRHNVGDAGAAPLEGGCSRATGLKA
jgi:hypothetical protein